MKRIIFIGLLVLVILVSGCVKEQQPENWKNWQTIKSQKECESYGGKWHSWSFWQAGEKVCDIPYPDSGKICKDSKDCISKLCLYVGDNPIIDASSSGKCAEWISTSCVNHHYFIKNGKIVEEVCVE